MALHKSTPKQTAPAQDTPQVVIRYLTKRYIDATLNIEGRTSPNPWSYADFDTALRRKHAIGVIICDARSSRVIGFMVYEFTPSAVLIRRLAVDLDYQRRGIGAALLDHAVNKAEMSLSRRARIHVDEENLGAQLFLKARQWQATGIDKSDQGNTYVFVGKLSQS